MDKKSYVIITKQ